MNRKQIEKQLKKDLNAATPSSFDVIKQKCGIEERAREEVVALSGANGGETTLSKPQKNKIFAAALAGFMLIAVLVGYLVHSLSGNGFLKPSGGGYFVIYFNPSVQLSYDEDGVITEAIGLNDDGKALLNGLSLEDKTYDKATDEIVERCVKLGYFSKARKNNALLVSANKTDGGADKKLTDEMQKLFSSSLKEKNLQGAVLTGIEETKALTSSAKAYGIDAQKYALILSCLAAGIEIDEEDYATITVSQLYAKLEEKSAEDKKASVGEQIQQAKEDLENLLSTLSERIEEIISRLDEALEELNGEETELTQLEPFEMPQPPQGEGHGQNQGNQGGFPPVFDTPKDRYEQYRGTLLGYVEELAEDIEDVSNVAQCSVLVNKILQTLTEMTLTEDNLQVSLLLLGAIDEINEVYGEIKAQFSYLNYVNSTPEEKESARLDKFDGEFDEEDDEFDFDKKWKEKEKDDFYSAWYSLKAEWQNERDKDFR